MLVNTIERDARNDGWKAGIVQGKSFGLAEGEAPVYHQKALKMVKQCLHGISAIRYVQKCSEGARGKHSIFP